MMQINRTDNGEMNPVGQRPQAGNTPHRAAGDISGWSVQTDTAGYVRKALSLFCESDTSRIEEARSLLAAGRLDSPAALKEAAANLATLGI